MDAYDFSSITEAEQDEREEVAPISLPNGVNLRRVSDIRM